MVETTKKIQVFTFGCSMNIAESEMIKGILIDSGYEITEDSEQADLFLFNSCFVKSPTEHKLISKIKKYIDKFPTRKVLISGCMPEVRSNYLEKKFPAISIIGPSSFDRLPEHVDMIFQNQKIKSINQPRLQKLGFPRVLKNPVIGIIPIAEGCNHNCNFCCTRLARGKIFSYDTSEILNEIKVLLQVGCKEFWITGQDVAAYNKNSFTLPDLIKEINKINSPFFYRIGMMNPSNLKKILPKYLESLKETKMYKFVHLPLQSGSNKILKLMNRTYTVDEFIEVIIRIRTISKISLATDIIVGFPGENNDDFDETLKILENMQPDIVNISQFGARPKTVAAKMNNKIPSDIIKDRSKKITDYCNELIKNKNKEWINWEGSVLISEIGKKSGFIGRNFCYKPILLKDKGLKLGQVVRVKVREIGKGYLIGSEVNAKKSSF